MDVVKKNIEKIGGTVTIESVKGTLTNIFFKIPLTLAIIASMEIRERRLCDSDRQHQGIL